MTISPKGYQAKARRDKAARRGDDRRAPPGAREVTTTAPLERFEGGGIEKVTRVSYPGARVLEQRYQVCFDGHPAIAFSRLWQARERAKEPAPVASANQAGEGA